MAQVGSILDSGRFRIDLHVHTARYSPCAEYVPPQEIAEAAHNAGLHGVVLTDHDVLWEKEEYDALQCGESRVSFYRGIECTTSGGHLVIIGLEDAGMLPRGVDFEEAVNLAHGSGATVVFAHPFRDSDPNAVRACLTDAIEIASTSFDSHESRAAIELARRCEKPVVASSDAHALSRIGWAWTSFPRKPHDELELARMIRTGQGVPVAPRPFPR
jgi:predicted metal-dependent phosphoesterase TrpH